MPYTSDIPLPKIEPYVISALYADFDGEVTAVWLQYAPSGRR